ncbi:hypothetical protein E2C01_039757 [Portunus trituberculatus]|uniref:Uncharacterized protein n=1 Tax=Portunus trituberculatus TaxID=210409 RepID=A0A5B7FM44_PORTR|nr:hypothetical protein [Portunus trituberculatus]
MRDGLSRRPVGLTQGITFIGTLPWTPEILQGSSSTTGRRHDNPNARYNDTVVMKFLIIYNGK